MVTSHQIEPMVGCGHFSVAISDVQHVPGSRNVVRGRIDEACLSPHRDQSSHLIPASERQLLGLRP